jgi:hypothetical protein
MVLVGFLMWGAGMLAQGAYAAAPLVGELAMPLGMIASSAIQLAAQKDMPSGPLQPLPGKAPAALTPADIPTRESEPVHQARMDFLFKEGQRTGRSATILTGAQGLQSEPVLGQTSLLGVGR